jgi:hypothetical protein
MKQIPVSGGGGARWDSGLLEELSYIRKHLRYKPKRKTYLPVIFWGCILLFTGGLCTFLLITEEGRETNYVFLFLALSSFITYPGLIIRYLSSLTFKSIPTDFFSQQNQYLVERFLQSENMIIYRHPEAPEVFQIQSRKLYGNDDEREIIIFIADDMRILINSHFTQGGWLPVGARRHHRKMAKMLKQWIAKNAPAGSSLTRQKF